MGLRAAALASMACGSENWAYVEGSSGSNWMICLARSRDVVRGDPGPRDWDSAAIPRASNGIEVISKPPRTLTSRSAITRQRGWSLKYGSSEECACDPVHTQEKVVGRYAGPSPDNPGLSSSLKDRSQSRRM